MLSISLFFIICCSISSMAAAASTSPPCSSPFFQVGSFCVYWNASDSVNWCAAAEMCLSIGGELAIDLHLIRAVRASYSGERYLFVGATDLLVEQGSNRTGWRWTDGRLVEALDSDWKGTLGDAKSDDFLVLANNGMTNVRFENRVSFLCQPLTTPNSGYFVRTEFLKLGNISPFYCYTEIFNIMYESQCSLRCAHRWQCRAALYNRADGRCRMLDFTDASVGDDIEKSGDWSKLVKVY